MATLTIRRVKCLALNNVSIYKVLSCGVADKKTSSKKTAEPAKASSAAKPTPAAKPAPAAKSTEAPEDPTKYHANEYFSFNSYSFYDLDMTIGPKRLKPPSKYAPLQPKA